MGLKVWWSGGLEKKNKKFQQVGRFFKKRLPTWRLPGSNLSQILRFWNFFTTFVGFVFKGISVLKLRPQPQPQPPPQPQPQWLFKINLKFKFLKKIYLINHHIKMADTNDKAPSPIMAALHSMLDLAYSLMASLIFLKYCSSVSSFYLYSALIASSNVF